VTGLSLGVMERVGQTFGQILGILLLTVCKIIGGNQTRVFRLGFEPSTFRLQRHVAIHFSIVTFIRYLNSQIIPLFRNGNI
jgi:hypothetical protein